MIFQGMNIIHLPTTWILHLKLEKFLQNEELATMEDDHCAAWAIFLCQPKNHSDKEYVRKIYM